MNGLNLDYLDRVYAGVLGKVIGVYMGHPCEGWTHERIMKEAGEHWYYLHENLEKNLIATDDDIAGTFLFIRAAEDFSFEKDKIGYRIAQTWLNALVEGESVLAWSGRGMSTEHTAYLNLKKGLLPPQSGSIKQNGKAVAEQIGGQIFIDGWGFIAPGEPKLAVELAGIAASVSHDGEGIYGAQVVAAIEAMAFGETDFEKMILRAVEFIPESSDIYKMNKDLVNLRRREKDWRKAYRFMLENYSYAHYPGKCHMVPNHGLVILSLLWGDGNFQKSMMIVNTCGWDTDCNSGNVGAILGVRTGLKGINENVDFRGPVADRFYVPYAEGGEAITDAVETAWRIANIGRKVHGLEPLVPKNNARFHFTLPGSVQGFLPVKSRYNFPLVWVSNSSCSSDNGDFPGMLKVSFEALTRGEPFRVEKDVFTPFEKRELPRYKLTASPLVYSGQSLSARVGLPEGTRTPVQLRLYALINKKDRETETVFGDFQTLSNGSFKEITLRLPDSGGRPYGRIGIEGRAVEPDVSLSGSLLVDCIAIQGIPDCSLIPPGDDAGAELWWTFTWNGNPDVFYRTWPLLRFSKHGELGVLCCGTRDWDDYRIAAQLTPHLFKRGGIGIRCRGLRRYVGLFLTEEGTLALVSRCDEEEVVLAETPVDFVFDQPCSMHLAASGNRVWALLNNEKRLEGEIPHGMLSSGSAAVFCDDGTISVQDLRVSPLD